MRGLRIRYRRDITCAGFDCDERLAREGEASEALNPDGSPVATPGFNYQNSSLEPSRKAGHQTIVYFPKDVMVVKSIADAADTAGPKAVLRR